MTFIRKNIVLIYLFLIAVQISLVTQYFINSLPVVLPNYFYFESVALYFNDHKRVELISYMFTAMVLGLSFFSVLFGESSVNLRFKRYGKTTLLALCAIKNIRLIIFAAIFLIILPILIFHSKGAYQGKIFFQLIDLIISLFFPFWDYFLRYKHDQVDYFYCKISRLQLFLVILFKKQFFYFSIIVIGFLQLGYLFYDPIINEPKIIREYLNIPETTILANGKKIENTSYLQQLNINAKISIDNKNLSNPFVVNRLKSPELDEWLKLNKFEINWQILSRFLIHHNSYMFIPINDFALGKDISMIKAQYGLGSAWGFQKILSFGNLSLDGWLKLSYFFYFFYFGIFLFVIWFITRSLSWTTMIFLFSLSLINFKGYGLSLLAPGESPWRHFFDIVIIYLLYQYVEKKNFVYYILALGLGIVSVAINPQIGLMIFISTIATGLFYALYEKQHIKSISISSFIALIIAVICFKASSSANDLTLYYLDGVIGSPIKIHQMLKIFIIFIVGYILLWKILKDRLLSNYIHIVFLVLYSQELFLYTVWHYDAYGLHSRTYIYVLTFALLCFPFRKFLSKRYLMVGLSTAIALIYIDSVFSVLKSKYKYDIIFDHHTTYHWNMDRAHIISTMNPIYFQNGVALIQKYSKGQNGIYIISEYDNFLPFLAHKYSMMPFFDLKWYLMTPKELKRSILMLKVKKPKYIFVDTGVHRNLNNEIIDSNIPQLGHLHKESIWRAQRLNLLYSIFYSVENNYELIEQGNLISVYKRK